MIAGQKPGAGRLALTLTSLFYVISPVMAAPAEMYNVTSKLYELPATPLFLWGAVGLGSLGLFLWSLMAKSDSENLVAMGAMAAFAALGFAFFGLSSFAVDQMTAVALTSDDASILETHTVYSWPWFGYAGGVLAALAFGNLLRISALYKEVSLESNPQRKETQYYD